MDFVNQTGVEAGWTMGFERDGRELVIVAVKATFVIPHDGTEAMLAEEQVQLTEADQFTGVPGQSAPIYEVDFAHRKPMCDVLLNGSAYSQNGPATSVQVGLRVGQMTKVFAVVGTRVWRAGALGAKPSSPVSFEAMPISYDNAYGGVSKAKGDPPRVKTFVQNPVGRGYVPDLDDLDGAPMPNTEDLARPVTDPRGTYEPMAFGALGRSWQPRAAYAGTYDEGWLENRAPFWPDDFDYRYFQAAARDQQVPYPQGGETVVLNNLTPDGHVAFLVPSMRVPIWFLPERGKDVRVDAVIDTILIEPDLGRFMLTWRAVLPMRRSCFDLRQTIAGEMPEAWQRARRYGAKPYYKGLAELVAARRGSR